MRSYPVGDFLRKRVIRHRSKPPVDKVDPEVTFPTRNSELAEESSPNSSEFNSGGSDWVQAVVAFPCRHWFFVILGVLELHRIDPACRFVDRGKLSSGTKPRRANMYAMVP